MPHLHAPTAQALATTTFETVFANTALGILPAAQAGLALTLATNRSPTPLLRHRNTIRKRHFRAAWKGAHAERHKGADMKTRLLKESGSPEVGSTQASVGSVPSQATASTIAHKYRRALKNGTGATLTFLELQLLARLGALDLVTRAENTELMNWREILAGSPSGPPSPPTAVVGSPPASASVPQNQATDDRAYIKALGLAT